MKIVKDIKKYYFYRWDYEFNLSTLEFSKHLKNFYGWKVFCFSEKAWRFNEIKIIDEIKSKFPDVQINSDVLQDYERSLINQRQEELVKEKSEEIKRATVSNLEVKGIKGTLYNYQKLTVEFAINSNGRALLALDMGTGKSLCSLAYIVHTKQAKSLIVCPSSMKHVWAAEVKKWTNLKSFVVNSKNLLSLQEYRENDIIILNYDILKKNFELLSSVMFDCLVIDESAYCKNYSTLRSKIVRSLSRKINSVLLLSGRPIINRPVELFSQLNIIDPATWKNYMNFVYRYCAAWQSPWGLDVSGSSNIEELKERISKYVIRIKKEDVLKDLPKKNYINIPVEIDEEAKDNYQLAENSLVQFLKEIKNKSDKEINKSLQAEKLVKINHLRQLSTMGKVKVATEILENIIDNNQKIVVFSSYNDPLSQLQQKFSKQSVMVIGSTNAEERMAAINKFQKDDKTKIFFGGLLSASTGITLTAANNILFLNYDWTPSNMEQAISRIDRIGQQAKSINIMQLIAINTIDQKMEEILKNKKNLINELMDDQVAEVETTSSVINNLFNLYSREN